ncbi:unnamed protein product [Medioppia subpectinata]|uniref:CUB domain-containing protein n=1 Tax=Medioppia subpectinata TaxID=1979941 RepID=A0A7R9KMR4_9ACAR|nr:unnamed protein product [Medioppia subpectinata]CAG2105242.1 unnamed protein product [Medioppia subpectinata]
MECANHMNQNESEILSPNYPHKYPNNYRCVWYITVADNKYIALKVNTFHTELKHDLVSVYDGHTEEDSQLLATYSGFAEDYDYTGVPRNGMTKFRSVISSGNKLLVKFRTDYVTEYTGFNITYESIDQGCGLTLNATRKEIVSPGYPSEYIFALVCVWNISVPSDMMVMITFADFQTEYNFDYLRIHDGFDRNSNMMVMITFADFQTEYNFDYLRIHDGFDRNSSFVTYTGDNIPPQIIFVSNEIHIMFNSDHNKPRRGFNLTYHAFKKPGQNKEIYEAFTDNQDVTEYSARPLAYISIALNAMLVIVVIILLKGKI